MRDNWFISLIQIQGSIVPNILPRVLICGLFGLIITFFDQMNYNMSIPILSSVVPSLVLGLLLVFRTNTAYERFWEGRKLWGNLVNTSRNLARQIWVTIETETPYEIEEKKIAIRLITAFCITTKQHLRSILPGSELSSVMTDEQILQLQTMTNPPYEISCWLSQYLQERLKDKKINAHQLTALLQLLDQLVDSLGGCERILRTPIPLAYSIHLKQILFLYCLTLPFAMVEQLHWWTGLVTALIGFAMFGIEEIGVEIENPFGFDPNDLPLDKICQTIEQNLEDLMRC